MSRKRRELRQLTIDGGYVVEAVKDLQDTWGGRRKGAGRPKVAAPTYNMSVRVSADLNWRIRVRAKMSGVSVSDYMRSVLEEHVPPAEF